MDALDEIDRHILFELQQNGRMTNQELADRVGLTPSPCLRRVRALEESGVISGYAAVVDPESVDLPITAFVHLTLDNHSQDAVARVEEEIASIPDVIEAYLLAGDADYLLRVAVPSLRAYERLMRSRLRGIPSIASIQTTFAMGVTKPPSPLPLG